MKLPARFYKRLAALEGGALQHGDLIHFRYPGMKGLIEAIEEARARLGWREMTAEDEEKIKNAVGLSGMSLMLQQALLELDQQRF